MVSQGGGDMGEKGQKQQMLKVKYQEILWQQFLGGQNNSEWILQIEH